MKAGRVLIVLVVVAVAIEAAACGAFAFWARYGKSPYNPIFDRLTPIMPSPLIRWSCTVFRERFPNDPGHCYRAP